MRIVIIFLVLSILNYSCKKDVSPCDDLNFTHAVSAGNDTTVHFGSSAMLHARGGVSYKWTPALSLSCSACQTTTATPKETTVYYVVAQNTYGCTRMDSVLVTISC